MHSSDRALKLLPVGVDGHDVVRRAGPGDRAAGAAGRRGRRWRRCWTSASFVTVGWRASRNLVWLVLENGVFLETGGQPIATGARHGHLAPVPRAAGHPS